MASGWLQDLEKQTADGRELSGLKLAAARMLRDRGLSNEEIICLKEDFISPKQINKFIIPPPPLRKQETRNLTGH